MKWFRNLKVRSKLLVVFGFIFLLSFSTSVISIIKVKYFNEQIDIIVKDRYLKVNKMENWKEEVLTIAELLRNMLLVDDQKQIDAYMNKVRELQSSVADKLKYLEGVIKSDEGKKLLSELKSVREEYIKEREAQYNLLKEGKKREARDLLLGSVANIQKKYLDSIEKNVNFQEKQMMKVVEVTDAKYQQAIILLVGSGAITLLFIIGFIIILTKSVSSPIVKCASVAKKISTGDLTLDDEFEKSAVSKDEIGKLMFSVNEMQGKLRNLLSELKSTSDTLASASQELSASSEQMSRGVTEQSGRASQIATSSTEMSQTVIDIAKNASSIASSAVETAKTAKKGEGIVDKAVEEVKAIAQTVSESAGLMTSLGDRSRQIGDIRY